MTLVHFFLTHCTIEEDRFWGNFWVSVWSSTLRSGIDRKWLGEEFLICLLTFTHYLKGLTLDLSFFNHGCLILPFRKAHLILRRLERVSSHCSSLLRSAYIQSRVETVPYLFCRSEEVRPAGMVWYSILKDTKITCEEKMVSMARNTYGESKGRWGRVLPSVSTETLHGRGSSILLDPGAWVGWGTAEDGPSRWNLPARPKQMVSPVDSGQRPLNYSFFSIFYFFKDIIWLYQKSLLFKPFLMDGYQSWGRSFQVETKRPLLFFLLPATLCFLPAMDPWRRPMEGQFWPDP